MNRRKLALFILLCGLAAALVYSYTRYPRQLTVERLKFTPGAPAPARKQEAAAADRKVRLDLLDRKSHVGGVRKNIFVSMRSGGAGKKSTALLLPPPPPPPPPPPVTPAPPVKPPVEAPPQPPQPPPPPPLAKFVFLGFLEKEGVKTIFLSRDKDVILVKKGDKIAGNYQAVNMTGEMLTLRYLQDGREISIPLVENKPLGTPIR